MVATIDVPGGGYRYIPHAFQYSGGVEALPGHRIERVEFCAADCRSPRASPGSSDTWASRRCRSPAFCACELRSPAQFTDQGFIDFNRHYTGTLMRWGVMKDPEDNPVARSNVIPPLRQARGTELPCVLFRPPGRGRGRLIRHRRQR